MNGVKRDLHANQRKKKKTVEIKWMKICKFLFYVCSVFSNFSVATKKHHRIQVSRHQPLTLPSPERMKKEIKKKKIRRNFFDDEAREKKKWIAKISLLKYVKLHFHEEKKRKETRKEKRWKRSLRKRQVDSTKSRPKYQFGCTVDGVVCFDDASIHASLETHLMRKFIITETETFLRFAVPVHFSACTFTFMQFTIVDERQCGTRELL